MNSPRAAALKVLCQIENNTAYSAQSLNEQLVNAEFADRRDASLLSALVLGVLEHKITLDYNISLYLKNPIKKLHPQLLNIMRCASYQILYMDRIPDSAAINEAVNMAKENKLSYASGLVNAVLRKISAAGTVLPDENKDETFFLSVKYSFPVALIEHFTGNYGRENALTILKAASGRRPIFLRVNTVKTTTEKLIALLTSEGVNAECCDSFDNCITVSGTGDITALSAYKKGLFHVQDISSQHCAYMLGAKKGETVADFCSAPGGKAFTAAQMMENTGRIYAFDIYPHKTRLIEEGAQRLGLTCIDVACCDAVIAAKSIKNADRVLCDVPCSGLGVTGRKPEIRYKYIESFKELPPLQYSILESASAAVKTGGTLVYSTCTLNKAENEEVCDRFLAKHREFIVSDDESYKKECSGNYITVFPSENGGDGFFTACFIKR